MVAGHVAVEEVAGHGEVGRERGLPAAEAYKTAWVIRYRVS